MSASWEGAAGPCRQIVGRYRTLFLAARDLPGAHEFPYGPPVCGAAIESSPFVRYAYLVSGVFPHLLSTTYRHTPWHPVCRYRMSVPWLRKRSNSHVFRITRLSGSRHDPTRLSHHEMMTTKPPRIRSAE